MDVLIIGGGASGLAAALRAAQNKGCTVTVLERQSRVGKKLAATGNGRCNLSNYNCGLSHYHGNDPSFVNAALSAYSVRDTLSLFEKLGLHCISEADGRIYPNSGQASSVVDILRLAAEDFGIRTVLGTEVIRLKKQDKKFRAVALSEEGKTVFEADKVILCCGGAAGTHLGGTDSGYRLLKQLGHSCTEIKPSLVQLKTASGMEKSLKGVRADCSVRAYSENQELFSTTGEVQFTDYGLSGPAIFEMTDCTDITRITLDFLPDVANRDVYETLTSKTKLFPMRKAEYLLVGLIHNRIAKLITRAVGIPFDIPLSEVTGDQIRKAVALLKCYSFPVLEPMGFEQAQVTAGGVCTMEFDPSTMESRLCPGLYACGEVLDINGDCGGYNLQWAWSSGLLAGSMIGE